MKVLWEQDMTNGSDEFKNGCISMHCDARAGVKIA